MYIITIDNTWRAGFSKCSIDEFSRFFFLLLTQSECYLRFGEGQQLHFYFELVDVHFHFRLPTTTTTTKNSLFILNYNHNEGFLAIFFRLWLFFVFDTVYHFKLKPIHRGAFQAGNLFCVWPEDIFGRPFCRAGFLFEGNAKRTLEEPFESNSSIFGAFAKPARVKCIL